MAFPSGWNRKVKITIDKDKVPATQTDFTFPVTEDILPDEIFDADGPCPAKNGGGDIRFSSDSQGNIQLAREVRVFVTDNDPANGKAEIWVKVPTLSSVSNTDIWCWYCNPGATEPLPSDTYGRENAWPSEYKAVWHLEEDGDGTTDEYLDSTSNDNDGTGGGGNPLYPPVRDEANGKIRAAQSFNGTSQKIYVDHDSSLNITNNITFNTWVNPSGGAGTYSRVLMKGTFTNRPFLIGKQDTKFGFAYYDTGASLHLWESTATWASLFPSTVWAHIAISFTYGTGSSINVRINDASIAGSWTTGSGNVAVATSSDIVRIGTSYFTTEGEWWSGLIDETWVLNATKDSNWMTTVYNSQDDPSTFASAGTPEDALTFFTKIYIY